MKTFLKPFVRQALLGALGAVVVAPMCAVSQDDATVMEEIVVQAPITVERETSASVADPTSRTESVTLRRSVYLADLDLTKYEDVRKLEARIRDVAEGSCAKLDGMFPLEGSRSRDVDRCVRRAIESANAAMEKAIAAAN